MEARYIPLTVLEVIDMLVSGKEKLALELVRELRQNESTQTRRNAQ